MQVPSTGCPNRFVRSKGPKNYNSNLIQIMWKTARPPRDQIGTVPVKFAIDNGREAECAPNGCQLFHKFDLGRNPPFLKTVQSSANVRVRS